jgi:uncharacterized alkaline shock family protein YloU
METRAHEPAGLQLADGEGREAIGATRVANEVVASIAALAALQVDGVSAMYQPAGHQIDRILRRAHAHRGVRVDLIEDSLHLDLWIVIEAGGSVPVIGGQVQRRVADAVDRMLGLRVAEVNVFVSEVIFR